MTIKTFLGKHRYFIVAMILVIITGHVLGVTAYRISENNQKEQLMDIALIAAASVNPPELKTLDGTTNDIGNANFYKLRHRFRNIENTVRDKGIVWIYSVLPRNNQLFFSFDSLVPGEPGYEVEPGGPQSLYLEPPAELLTAIREKKTIQTDRYTDEWGTFISAFVPVIDPDTGEVLAIIGADKDYSYFAYELRKAVGFPFATILLALALFFMLYVYIYRTRNARSEILRCLDRVQHEKAKVETLLTVAGEPIIICDETGVITFINQAAKITLRCEYEEILGRSIFETISTDLEGFNTVTFMKKIFNQLVRKREKVTFSSLESKANLVCLLNGRKLPVIFDLSPVVINNKTVGIIGVFSDISHIVEMDAMKSNFISLASHQLRTPISKMKWMIEMLTDDTSTELSLSQKELIRNISDTNQQLITVVTALLNISRFESGSIAINSEPTNLGVLIHSVLKTVEHFYQGKNQQVTIDIPATLPSVNTDPTLVSELIRNLLNNAIQYTPAGGQIQLKITLGDRDIVTEISDNGCGIPEGARAKIFQRFFRADNAQKITTSGTGLGLYLAKIITEAVDGKIWFESKEHEGTTFWFSLPLSGITPRKGNVTIEIEA